MVQAASGASRCVLWGGVDAADGFGESSSLHSKQPWFTSPARLQTA